MATLTIDLSGRRGLVERYQGDLNDTLPKPNLRYTGEDGQFADGIFNPMKVYGYVSPANNTYASLTGTVAANINSMQYDAEDDILYLSEAGINVLKLAGLDDTSLANHITLAVGSEIQDMLLYEMNAKKALIYAVDSNDADDGMYVGFTMLEAGEELDIVDTEYDPETAANDSEAVMDDGSSSPTKLAQRFAGSDLSELDTTFVEVFVRRSAGTGVGITIKVSLQTDADRATSPYTYRNGWSNAVTDYAINDTVENNSVTYKCDVAHDASATANDEPGVGSNWKAFWSIFQAPSGTELASGTFLLSSLDVGSSGVTYNHKRIDFGSTITLVSGTNYWIVVEEVGTNMTAADELAWFTTTNDNALIADQFNKTYIESTAQWTSYNPNEVAETFGFAFGRSYARDDDWSSTIAAGAFDEETGQDSFLYLADNAFVYWFVGNDVHLIDGGATGGALGRINERVLTFPSYISVTDVAETRSRMYLGIQTSNITNTTDDRFYTAHRSGVFIWDRRSQILGATDFYPTPGAKEVKNLFTSANGDVKAITVNNSGFTEIRGAIGNQYAVLHTLEKQAYPKSRRGISQLNGMTVWLGANGIFYAYGSIAPGEPEQLYKIGTMAAEANAGLAPGAIFVGNKNTSEPRSAIIFGWADSDPSYIVQRWYPHGDGTIATVAQTGNQGDVFSKVYLLPTMSTVKDLSIYCAPTTSTGATTIATLKIYFNQSSTATMTKTITQAMASRGYVTFDINKPYVNAVQVEVEYSTSQTLGDDDFLPSFGILQYESTNTHSKSQD